MAGQGRNDYRKEEVGEERDEWVTETESGGCAVQGGLGMELWLQERGGRRGGMERMGDHSSSWVGGEGGARQGIMVTGKRREKGRNGKNGGS